jgi:hypothetical protein
MTKPKKPKSIAEAQAELDRIVEMATAVRKGLDKIDLAVPTDDPEEEDPRLAAKDAEIRFWRDLVTVISDITSGRPEITAKRAKEAWQGTALLQSSLLAEISRACTTNLRSKKQFPRPLGTDTAFGPKTEAIAERAGPHIHLQWIRRGVHYKAVVYEPLMMDVTPALADALALAVEHPLTEDKDHD